MPSGKMLRTGILCAVLAATGLSCGETQPTEPDPVSEIIAVKGNEKFLNSPQRESRELLIDGRVTDIEWAITGDASVIRMHNEGGERGGTYYLSVRSLWTVDESNAPSGILFLLQWPDRTENRLHMPLLTAADVLAENGDTLIDCTKGTDSLALMDPANWTINRNIQEDEVSIEIFSSQAGGYPKDVWRWGAETTDPATPVNGTEFGNAGQDSVGSLEHPGGSYMEDSYDIGSGPVHDAGNYSYMLANHDSTDFIPIRIVSKGTRDTRLNRGKPTFNVVWETVSRPFGPCETINPIRLDDASAVDKTWNPGDYVPSFRLILPTQSQADVVARGGWNMGKWGLEIRRDLITHFPPIIINGVEVPGPPRPDDLPLVPGGHYAVRFTIVDGTTKARSVSDLIPIYLRP